MFKPSQRHSGIVFALVTACGLGSITTQAKIFYADGGNALTLMLARFFASTLVFGLLLILRGQKFSVADTLRTPLMLLGLIWSGSMICYLTAVETISVSLAVLVLYFYPLLVLGYSFLRRQLQPSPVLIALFLAAFAGLYLALSGGTIRVDMRGILFAMLASSGAAYTFISGARVAPQMSPLLMTFWINATGLLIILPLIIGKLNFAAGTGGAWALAAATACYLIAILSQFEALARLPAARAAFLLNLEPVVSILLARLVLDETMTLVQASGVVIVISAIILSLRFKPTNA